MLQKYIRESKHLQRGEYTHIGGLAMTFWRWICIIIIVIGSVTNGIAMVRDTDVMVRQQSTLSFICFLILGLHLLGILV